jgi:hypothetical protein
MNLIPTPEEFFLNVPLYRAYKINEVDLSEIHNIVFYTGTLDMYCIGCKSISTYKSLVGQTMLYKNYTNAKSSTGSLTAFGKVDSEFDTLVKNKYYKVSFLCSRECGHTTDFYIQVSDGRISKVGQYPSQYDLNKTSLRKYDKTLSQDYLKELNMAVSLASNGIGIGSFVYLRRIFESLIEEAHKSATEIEDWNEENYQKSPMHQKIDILKEFLPSFLVENKIIYSVLSKGIHELSEDVCLDSFEPLMLAIELILDEKIKFDEQNRKIKSAKNSIQKIYEKMKGK